MQLKFATKYVNWLIKLTLLNININIYMYTKEYQELKKEILYNFNELCIKIVLYSLYT